MNVFDDVAPPREALVLRLNIQSNDVYVAVEVFVFVCGLVCGGVWMWVLLFCYFYLSTEHMLGCPRGLLLFRAL